ncbi:hypothetical protein AALA24_09770 [Anaerovoracaceae bacterium 42-11]
MNYDANYNPYEHLSQSLKEDGLPAYTPYIKNGYVQIADNGRIVMVPETHLDANAYRDWFTAAFPEGRTEVIRHTQPPYMLPDGNLKYPQEVFEVKLYKNSTDTLPAANGWGKAAYKDNGEFDEISTAVSKAFKNAMRNMGFGVDFDIEKIQESLPKYMELSAPGKLTEVAPLDNRILIKDGYVATSSQNNVADVANAPSQEAPAEGPVPADNPPAAPVFQIENEPENEVFAYLKEKESAAETASKELPQEETSVPMAEAPVAEDVITASNIEPEETTASNKEAESFSTKEDPRNVIFQTLLDTDPLAEYNGKKLGELYDNYKNILSFIVKPTFKWQQRIPEDVYAAIVEMMK